MSTTIQNLLQSALGDVARSTKWDVAFTFTNAKMFPTAKNVALMCKTASLPSRGHTNIDLKYMGRSIPIRGQIKYRQTWECTFYCDSANKLKSGFETWIEALDETVHYAEEVSTSVSNTISVHSKTGYVKDIAIYQESFDESQNSCRYILKNCFPIEVSPIELSAEGPGSLEEFTVTFAYSHYELEVLKGESGNFVDSFMSKLKSGSSDLISSLVGAAYGEISSFLDASGINALADTITSIPQSALSSFTSAFTSAFNSSLALGNTTSLSGIASSISGGLSSLTSGLSSMISSAVSSVSSALGSIAGTASAYMSNMLSGVSDAISGLLSGGASMVSGLSGSVASALNSVTNQMNIANANTTVIAGLDQSNQAAIEKARAAAKVMAQSS